MSTNEQIPPQCLEFELTILGSCIVDKDCLAATISRCKEEFFFKKSHRIIFNAIKNLYNDKIPVEPLTICKFLEKKDILNKTVDSSEITVLPEFICSHSNINYYIDQVIEQFNFRNLIYFLDNYKTASFSSDQSYTKLINKIRDEFEKLHEISTSPDGVYFNWNYNYENIQPDITFCDCGILWSQGIGLFTGPAGKGKTNIMLAAGASLLNKDCDSINLKINSSPTLYIDTENQSSIFHRNVYRALVNRADLPFNTKFDAISFVNIRSLETYEEKQNWFFNVIRSKKYKCFLLDGVGDMVLDVNDTPSCVPFVSKLCAYTLSYDCSVLLTLHGNPLANAEKARGVLGSELLRKSDCNILLQVKKNSRCITTEFSLGKNRAAKDSLTQYFEWDSIREMHVSCNSSDEEETLISKIHYNTIAKAMGDNKYKSMELISLIQSTLESSLSTAKRKLSEMKKNGMLDKIDNYYRLCAEELLKYYSSIP